MYLAFAFNMSNYEADRLAVKAGWVIHRRSFNGIGVTYAYTGDVKPTADKLVEVYSSLVDALRSRAREHAGITAHFVVNAKFAPKSVREFPEDNPGTVLPRADFVPASNNSPLANGLESSEESNAAKIVAFPATKLTTFWGDAVWKTISAARGCWADIGFYEVCGSGCVLKKLDSVYCSVWPIDPPALASNLEPRCNHRCIEHTVVGSSNLHLCRSDYHFL